MSLKATRPQGNDDVGSARREKVPSEVKIVSSLGEEWTPMTSTSLKTTGEWCGIAILASY